MKVLVQNRLSNNTFEICQTRYCSRFNWMNKKYITILKHWSTDTEVCGLIHLGVLFIWENYIQKRAFSSFHGLWANVFRLFIWAIICHFLTHLGTMNIWPLFVYTPPIRIKTDNWVQKQNCPPKSTRMYTLCAQPIALDGKTHTNIHT